jgi:hypothetical protein
MQRFIALPLLALTLAAAAPLQADPITDQIDAARRAYEAGDARVAIQALQFAVSQIEQQLTQQQLQLLPEPLPGWTADTAAAESSGLTAMIAGTQLTRSYQKTDTDQTVKITVTADSPLLSMMSMMMSAPILMQANPNSSPYTFGGFRGILEQDANAGTAKITLMVGTRILVQIDGAGGVDRQTLEAYLQAMNLQNLEKALLG